MVLTMWLLILPERPSTSHLTDLSVQECKILVKTTALSAKGLAWYSKEK